MPWVVGVSLFAAPVALAQASQTRPTAAWVAAGFGLTAPDEVGIVGTATVRRARLFLRARYASAGEFAGDWYEDIGLLVGAVLIPLTRRAQLAVGAGIGRARCRHCGNLVSQPDPLPSTGFLVDAEGRLSLTPVLGLVAYGYGDLNSTHSFGGLAVGIYVGRL